jgi:TRAP-type C4-dicarboxylate transport system permease small subunit
MRAATTRSTKDRDIPNARPLARAAAGLHDRVTIAGFRTAAALLGLIAVSFCYEVAVRYLFNAPTSWANALVSYLLCAAIFLAVPELTRRQAHVSINLLVDRASPRTARAMQRAILAAAAAACLFATWFSANATLSQYEQDITTISAYPVPKWWVSIWIPYGLFNAGLHFLRQLFRAAPTAAATKVAP